MAKNQETEQRANEKWFNHNMPFDIEKESQLFFSFSYNQHLVSISRNI